MDKIMVKKRDGSMEPLDDEKYHQHVDVAVEGVSGVSASEIEFAASMNIVDGIRSEDIQESLISAAAGKIITDHRYVKPAARLLNQQLRKKVYGDYNPSSIMDQVTKNLNAGVYDKETLFSNYTPQEVKEILTIVDYETDDNFTYAGLKKMADGYLIKRYDEIKETPQESFIMIAMFTFAKYKEKYNSEVRLKWIHELYRALSTFEISLPTPIMGKLRTTFRNFISCVLIPLGDTKRSIARAFDTILTVVAIGAGIGLGGYDLRGAGADIDNGRMKHVGAFPLVKASEKTTKSFVQPDRDGSTTVFYNFFNVEIEKMLTWGNAKGTDDTRVRDVDHSISFNQLFFERYSKGEDITLFYTNDVPLLKTCLGDHKKFKALYEEYERTVPLKDQKKVPALIIFNSFISERVIQSRQYAIFLDAIRLHGGYKVPVNQSNLCLEILQPTFPLESEYNIKRNIRFDSLEDKERYYKLRNELFTLQTYEHADSLSIREEMRELVIFTSAIHEDANDDSRYDYFDLKDLPVMDETGVCIIGGINIGFVKVERLPIVSELMVRVLDELIDYNSYDSGYIEKAAKMRRGIGIGFSDVFHLLAINKVKYNTKEGMELLNERCELASYHMIKTSIQLAKDFGPCILNSDSKYSDGIFPIDTYCKTVDELVVKSPLGLDWDGLKVEAIEHGTRHSTLMANAPYGNGSIPNGSTSGIEPPRSTTYKKSGYIIVVPDYEEYGEYYTTAWSDEFNNIDFFKFVAVLQKWWDQATSLNQYHNLLRYPDGKIPKTLMDEEVFTAYYYGHPSMYYLNFKSKDKSNNEEDKMIANNAVIEEDDTDSGCVGGSCKI